MRTRTSGLTYAGRTDIGRVRAHNEDAVLIEPPLFAVADGLGGHEAGEVASAAAIEALTAVAPGRADAKALARAVRAANQAVIEAARAGRGRDGMGTTLTAAVADGSRIAVAHVGDSRAYLLHGGTLQRITRDHSMVADMIEGGTLTEDESRTHPLRSVITRALGTDPNMHADAFEVDAEVGDRLVLCSDGLSGMLTDERIAEVLLVNGDPERAVQALIAEANEQGGHDNISVVVVDIAGGRSRTPARAPRGWLPVLLWLVAAAAVTAIAAGGVSRYAFDRAYLVAEDGVVVVYQGLPGEFAGVSLSRRHQETTITVGLLAPVTAARLSAGIEVESLDAALALVERYRATAEARGAEVDGASGGP